MSTEFKTMEYKYIYFPKLYTYAYFRDIKQGAGELILKIDGDYFGYSWFSMGENTNIMQFVAKASCGYLAQKLAGRLPDVFDSEKTKKALIENVNEIITSPYERSPEHDAQDLLIEAITNADFEEHHIDAQIESLREAGMAEESNVEEIINHFVDVVLDDLYHSDIITYKSPRAFIFICNEVLPKLKEKLQEILNEVPQS